VVFHNRALYTIISACFLKKEIKMLTITIVDENDALHLPDATSNPPKHLRLPMERKALKKVINSVVWYASYLTVNAEWTNTPLKFVDLNEDIEALNQWLFYVEPLDCEMQIRIFQIAIDVRNSMRTFEDARNIWFEKYPE
jgi:hypothetical protein